MESGGQLGEAHRIMGGDRSSYQRGGESRRVGIHCFIGSDGGGAGYIFFLSCFSF